MLKKALLATPILSDAATLTASSEAASTPVGNVQGQIPSDLWVASDVASLEMDIDFGAGTVSWDLMWLGYTNFGSADSWVVKTAATQAALTSAPVFTSSSIGGWPQTSGLDDWDYASPFLFLGTARTERWARIEFTVVDPRLPPGYGGADFFQMGRLFVESAWQPTYHVDRGYRQIPGNEQVRRVETVGGVPRPQALARPNDFAGQVGFLTEAELLDFGFDLRRLRGTSRDVLLILDPDDTTRGQYRQHHGLMGPGALLHRNTDTFDFPLSIRGLNDG